MNNYVVDSSALLAFLADEKGADTVELHLASKTYMSTANWAEVITKADDWGVKPKELDTLFRNKGLIGGTLELFPLLIEDAITIGELRKKTKSQGLSLGDRACLALALRLNSPVLTADRSWLKLDLNVQFTMIR